MLRDDGWMNILALAIPLTRLLTCANLCASVAASSSCFVLNASTDWQPLLAGDLGLLLVVFVHGSGFPPDFHGPPSVVGSRLPQHIPPRQKCTGPPHRDGRNTHRTPGPPVARAGRDTHTSVPEMRACCLKKCDTHDGGSCDFAPS